MADGLISKELLRMCLDEFMKLTEKTRNEPGAGLMVFAMDGAESAIRSLRDKLDNFPTVDAAPIVHGRWEDATEIIAGIRFPQTRCTACGKAYWGYRTECYYCPNCGAKMDAKEVECDGHDSQKD